MNRALATLVVIEACVIALLAYLYFARDPSARSERPDRPEPPGVGTRATDEAPGRPSVASPDATNPAESEAQDVAAPDARAFVYGVARDSKGAPMYPGWVTAQAGAGVRTTVQLQEGGYYGIAGLAPGPWKLLMKTREGAEASADVELHAGPNRHDFTVEKLLQTRIVVVTPDGEPLSTALRKEHRMTFLGCPVVAIATREPPGRLPLTELRSHQRYLGLGEFKVFNYRDKQPPEVAGVLTLQDDPPFYVSAIFKHIVLETRALKEPVEELRFVLTPEQVLDHLATVKVRLVAAESGEPVSGRVEISDRQSGGAGTMGEGAIVCPNVQPELMQLTIWMTDREEVRSYIRVPDGGELDLGTFRLHPPCEISGRVVDANGKPVGCGIVARNLEYMTFPQPLRDGRSWQSDAHGVFKIRGVGRGRILLVAAHKEWALGGTIVDTSGGSVGDVEIRLRKGVPVTLKPRFGPMEQLTATVRDGNGVVLYANRLRTPRWPVTLQLAPGEYSVELADDDRVRKTIPVHVGAAPVEIELAP